MASDNFDRADGPVGANWVEQREGFDVISNQCHPDVDASNAFAFWDADTFSADQYSKITIAVTSPSSPSKVYGAQVRASEIAGSGRKAYVASWATDASSVVLELHEEGGAGTLTLQTIGSTTFADGDILELRVSGSTLKVYKNGGQIGTDESNSVIAAGKPGMMANGSGVRIDNWEGGDLAAAPVGAIVFNLQIG